MNLKMIQISKSKEKRERKKGKSNNQARNQDRLNMIAQFLK